MKKYFILALVLLFATSMAYAEGETFKIGGAYRMEAYDFQDRDHDGDAEDQAQYYDQRFRLQMSFMPADGVKAVLRGDYAETTWGDMDEAIFDPTAAPTGDNTQGPGGIGYRPNQGAGTLMIDKAYVDLDVSMVNLRVGLFGHGGFGNAIVNDNQGANIWAAGNFEPVKVDVLYTKLSEGTALTDEADEYDDTDLYDAENEDADSDLMGVQVSFSGGAFSAGGFYSTLTDDVAESTMNAIGLFGSTTLGDISLWVEIDMFSGDDGGDVDYVGTNFTANAEMAVSEQLTAGLDVFWAAGTEEDDEAQIAWLTDDWGYTPFDHGPFHFIQTTGIDNHEIEANAGAQGLNIYGTFAAMEELTIYGNVGYITPSVEDPDDNDVYVSSYTVFSIAAKYTFLPGTAFSLKYENISVSGEEIPDDPTAKIMGMLSVSF